MPRKKTKREGENPVLTWRVSRQCLAELDALAKLFGENRSQVLARLICEAASRHGITVESAAAARSPA